MGGNCSCDLPPKGRHDFTESEQQHHRPLPFDGTTGSGLGNGDANIWMSSGGLLGAGTWTFTVYWHFPGVRGRRGHAREQFWSESSGRFYLGIWQPRVHSLTDSRPWYRPCCPCCLASECQAHASFWPCNVSCFLLTGSVLAPSLWLLLE